MKNRDKRLCAYCGCPLTAELDVNHSLTYDRETDTLCCAPACAEGMRRLVAGERAQTVEDARCAEQWVPLVNRREAGGYNRAESLRLLSELCSAHTGDNLAAALVHNGFATEAQAASAHWLDNHIAEQAGNAAIIADCPEYSEADEVADALPPVRWLTCACCGESARGRQWFNRDHGYGGCLRCADWHTERYGEGSPDQHAAEPCGTTAYDMFGVRGVHFAIPGEQS